MKKDIHPALHPVIFRDSSAGVDFTAYSTLTSDVVEKVKGEDHHVILVDISSASHPFFTGKQAVVKSGQVEKFKARQAKKANA